MQLERYSCGKDDCAVLHRPDTARGEGSAVIEFGDFKLCGRVKVPRAQKCRSNRMGEPLMRLARNGVRCCNCCLGKDLPPVDSASELPNVGSAIPIIAQFFQAECVENGSEWLGIAFGKFDESSHAFSFLGSGVLRHIIRIRFAVDTSRSAVRVNGSAAVV